MPPPSKKAGSPSRLRLAELSAGLSSPPPPPKLPFVLAFGAASHGTLGASLPAPKRSVYTSPVASPPLPRSGDAPLTVVAGHKLTLVLTDSGRCYSWGNNVGNVLAHEKKFGKGGAGLVKAGKPVQLVAAGTVGKDDATLPYFLGVSSGAVLAYGKTNAAGNCAQVKNGRVPAPSPIKAAACGGGHTLLLTEAGEILCTGKNDTCQLGLSDTSPRRALTPLPFPSHSFTSVSCGWNHSAAVAASGELFTFGYGEHGRLGHGDERRREAPTIVEALKDELIFAAAVACGAQHTLVLSDSGDVYAFGWNMYGQCGAPPELSGGGNAAPLPHLALPGMVVTSVSGGFAHSAAVTATGDLYTFGFGDEGQLGHGTEESTHVPTKVSFAEHGDSLRCLSASAGHTHTAAVVAPMSSVQNEDRRRENRAKEVAKKVLLRFARAQLVKILLHKKYKVMVKTKVVKKKAAIVEEVVDAEAAVDREEVERMKLVARREEEERRRREREEERERKRKEELREEAERLKMQNEEVTQRRIEKERERRERERAKKEREEKEEKERVEREREEEAAARRNAAEEEQRRFEENERMRREEEEQRKVREARLAKMERAKAERAEQQAARQKDLLRKEMKRLSDAKKAADRLKKGRAKKEKVIPPPPPRKNSIGKEDGGMRERLEKMAELKKEQEEREERERLKQAEKDEMIRKKKEKERLKMIAKREERMAREAAEKEEEEAARRAAEEEERRVREEELAEERERVEAEERERRERERRYKAKLGGAWEPPAGVSGPPEPLADMTVPVGAGGFTSAAGWGRKLSKGAATGVASERGAKQKASLHP